MKTRLNFVAAVVALAALAACSEAEKPAPTPVVQAAPPAPAVSTTELRDARVKARANSLYMAQNWRRDNTALYGDYDILPNGDSTQDINCPQGDGWATLQLLSKDKSTKIDLKCSTFDDGLGCWLDSDFKTKPFAGDDKHCQPTTKVPFPLPDVKA